MMTRDPGRIQNYFDSLSSARKAILRECSDIAYLMKGGVSYNDLLHNKTVVERQTMLETIKQYRELETKTQAIL